MLAESTMNYEKKKHNERNIQSVYLPQLKGCK